MSITRKLMNVGSFRLQLSADAPYKIRSAIACFDHIVVTGTPLQPIDDFSDTNILNASIFTGVVEARRDSGRTLTGFDLSMWLGTDDGVGDVLDTTVSQSAATLSTWVSALVPSSLTVGTVTNTGLSTLTRSYFGMTRREALDAVCRAVNRAEWRVNSNFTVDAADPELLFRFDPTVVITRKPEGRDSGLQGLEASDVVATESVEGYTTRGIAVTNGMRTGAASITPPYRDGRNNLVVMERFVNAPDEDPLNALALAGTVVDEYSTPRTELRLRSDTYGVTRYASPGDWVYVYDLDAGIVDTANQVPFRGETISPKKLRIYGLTFPIQRGMGVYARRSTGSTYTYVDLTPYVQWEDGEVEWEVGAAELPLSGNGIQGTAARLGDNRAVAERSASSFGEVAYSQRTADQTGITTETDLTSLSVTWTASADRKYRTRVVGEVAATVADGAFVLAITDASNTAVKRATGPCLSTASETVAAEIRETGLSGSVTRKARLSKPLGTGSIGLTASSSNPAFILVEDIGPA